MGEVPVLAHGRGAKLSQSAVCLTYLAERSGKFRPEGTTSGSSACAGSSSTTRRSTAFSVHYRFLKNFAPAPNPGEALLLGRFGGNLAIVNQRLGKAPYLLGARPTIADISLTGYVYYPVDEFGFDVAKDHPNMGPWMDA